MRALVPLVGEMPASKLLGSKSAGVVAAFEGLESSFPALYKSSSSEEADRSEDDTPGVEREERECRMACNSGVGGRAALRGRGRATAVAEAAALELLDLSGLVLLARDEGVDGSAPLLEAIEEDRDEELELFFMARRYLFKISIPARFWEGFNDSCDEG